MKVRRIGPPWPARMLHALIVAAYPRRIRTRFGTEMWQLFCDSHFEVRKTQSRKAIAVFYWRAFSDLALNAIQARTDRGRGQTYPMTKKHFSTRMTRRAGAVESIASAIRSLCFSLRGLARAPGFTLVVLITASSTACSCHRFPTPKPRDSWFCANRAHRRRLG
jgi:hypothetical protein